MSTQPALEVVSVERMDGTEIIVEFPIPPAPPLHRKNWPGCVRIARRLTRLGRAKAETAAEGGSSFDRGLLDSYHRRWRH